MRPNFGLGKYGPLGDIIILGKITTSEFYFFSWVKVNLCFDSLKKRKIQNLVLLKLEKYISLCGMHDSLRI